MHENKSMLLPTVSTFTLHYNTTSSTIYNACRLQSNQDWLVYYVIESMRGNQSLPHSGGNDTTACSVGNYTVLIDQ